MNLKQYFKDEPYGAKKEMAEYLGITPTWLGLLIRKARRPSPKLAKEIEKAFPADHSINCFRYIFSIMRSDCFMLSKIEP